MKTKKQLASDIKELEKQREELRQKIYDAKDRIKEIDEKERINGVQDFKQYREAAVVMAAKLMSLDFSNLEIEDMLTPHISNYRAESIIRWARVHGDLYSANAASEQQPEERTRHAN